MSLYEQTANVLFQVEELSWEQMKVTQCFQMLMKFPLHMNQILGPRSPENVQSVFNGGIVCWHFIMFCKVTVDTVLANAEDSFWNLVVVPFKSVGNFVIHKKMVMSLAQFLVSSNLWSIVRFSPLLLHLVHLSAICSCIILKKKALWLNEWLVCLCVCFTQDHQYNWDDGIHRDLRSGLRPASSDKSSQAQNYKNQGRFATIKSASLVSLTNLFPLFHSIFLFEILKNYVP